MMGGVCEGQVTAIWWDWGLNPKLKRMPLKSLSKWCDLIYSLIYHFNFCVQYDLGSIRAEALRQAVGMIDCIHPGNS